MRRFPQAAIAILVPAIIFLIAIGLVGVGASAQRQRRAPASRRPIARPPAIDYSKFSHATKKHQGACDTCHKIPTDNWKRREPSLTSLIIPTMMPVSVVIVRNSSVAQNPRSVRFVI